MKTVDRDSMKQLRENSRWRQRETMKTVDGDSMKQLSENSRWRQRKTTQ